MMACNWPEGTCACYLKTSAESDPYGREWMHCEQGLTMTKASMARFMMFCLQHSVEIGSVSAFRPDIRGASVYASIRIHPDIISDFETATGGKLKRPPVIKLS